jgi:hypothetical protein
MQRGEGAHSARHRCDRSRRHRFCTHAEPSRLIPLGRVCRKPSSQLDQAALEYSWSKRTAQQGLTTSRWKSGPGKPPEEPGSEISGNRREAEPKGGGTKLQAVTRVNSAASKHEPVRDRVGRARVYWAKAAVRALESGAARNRSGVEESACSEGRSGDWGDPTAPAGRSIAAVARSGIRPQPKSRAVQRESHRVVVLTTPETTLLGAREGPGFGDARVARDGLGHGESQLPL